MYSFSFESVLAGVAFQCWREKCYRPPDRTVLASLCEPCGWRSKLGICAGWHRGAQRWRLPNINELESLVDCSRARPALAASGDAFHRLDTVYWSPTTSMYEPDLAWAWAWAWALYMDKGAVGVGLKQQGRFSVWAVRGAAIEQHP